MARSRRASLRPSGAGPITAHVRIHDASPRVVEKATSCEINYISKQPEDLVLVCQALLTYEHPRSSEATSLLYEALG